MFSIICAIGKNNEIGINNSLPWHIKKDLLFFKETTMNHKIVMGKNTYLSLPKSLKGRDLYVISNSLKEDNLNIISSPLDFINDNIFTEEEIFICGGASIYELFIPYCKKIYLTEIDKEFKGADTFFPTFDKNLYNKTILSKETENDINFSFVLYEKK